MKRRICVITGSRSDYGILFPVMKAIKSSSDLRLYIITTSMHLMKEFGYTVRDIKKDGFDIYRKINISYKDDTVWAVADSVGKAIIGFSKVFLKLSPDIILVQGDRAEMLAAAIAANYMNIPVAHTHGGEVSGHIDGVARHAITKLAHLHFPATQMAKERILRLGEEPRRVFVVGAPAIDNIINKRLYNKEKIFKKYNIMPDKPLIIVVQHPVSTQVGESDIQIMNTLEAVKSLKMQTIIIYPNSDAGGKQMAAVIKRYKKFPFMRVFNSLPHKDYLSLLKFSSVLVGNTSSGIVEAPSFNVPVVNIGIRQKGRERSANVIDVSHNREAIARAIKKALSNKKFKEQVKRCRNIYGGRRASDRIVKILSAIKLDKRLLQKQMTY